jgi:outer membrane protein assembly factor BamA
MRTAARALLMSAMVAGVAWAAGPDTDPAKDAPAPGPLPPAPAVPKKGLARWFDPSTAPFIPVPEIAIDPDSGTTLGLIPTWLKTDENHEITRIIAPDVLYNPYFGYGMHARVYGYTSGDEQWSVTGGIKERVEREFDAEYQIGRLRESRWSIATSLISDRDGTPRFFGIGNSTRSFQETNYTNQQQRAQVQVGFNLSHAWQISYTSRYEYVDVLPGTLDKVPSIETKFSTIRGLGNSKQFLNRLSVIYDTRDNLVVPTRGVELLAYAGLASSAGLLNDSMYSEAGGDGRAFWPVARNTVLVTHVALRYLPTAHEVPFWALSSIGGGQAVIGGEQPLRGYGQGRFYDRNSYSTTVELRRKVFTFDASSTFVDIEVTPFVDVGRVFARTSTFPLDNIHQVYGVGFRGIARPFVVGYVDIGYGSEGVAAFTGLNYPF